MKARENDRAGEKSRLQYSFYRSKPVVVYCRYLTTVRLALFLVVKKQNFKPFFKEKQSGNQGSVQSDADST